MPREEKRRLKANCCSYTPLYILCSQHRAQKTRTPQHAKTIQSNEPVITVRWNSSVFGRELPYLFSLSLFLA